MSEILEVISRRRSAFSSERLRIRCAGCGRVYETQQHPYTVQRLTACQACRLRSAPAPESSERWRRVKKLVRMLCADFDARPLHQRTLEARGSYRP